MSLPQGVTVETLRKHGEIVHHARRSWRHLNQVVADKFVTRGMTDAECEQFIAEELASGKPRRTLLRRVQKRLIRVQKRAANNQMEAKLATIPLQRRRSVR